MGVMWLLTVAVQQFMLVDNLAHIIEIPLSFAQHILVLMS